MDLRRRITRVVVGASAVALVACGGSGGPGGSGGSAGTGGTGGGAGSGGAGGAAANPPPGWSAPEFVADPIGMVGSIAAAINDAGDAYVAAHTFTNTIGLTEPDRFWGVRLSGGTWGPAVALNDEGTCDSSTFTNFADCYVQPKVGIASDGVATVAVPPNPTNSALLLYRIDGDTLPAAETHPLTWGLNGFFAWGDVLVLPDDTVWLRAGTPGNQVIRYSGGTWSAPESAPIMQGEALAVRADGTAVMVGSEVGHVISTYSGSWQATTTLEAEPDYDEDVVAHLGAGGWGIVGWQTQAPGGGGNDAWACILQGDVCGTPERLSTTGDAWSLSVVIDDAGKAHAAWATDDPADSTGNIIRGRDYDPATGWGAAYLVLDATSERTEEVRGVMLRHSSNGTVAAIWGGVSGDRRIYIANDNGGRLEPWPDPLVDEAGALDIAVSPAGHAIVVYEDGGASSSIRASLFAP